MEVENKKVLYPRDVISRRVAEVAEEISRDYRGREPVLIGVLKGAFIFMADLVRGLKVPCVIDFVRVASYGSGSTSSGNVVIKKDIETDITGKDVLIIEDIVDTGITMRFLVEKLKERNPRSLKVCAFIDKRGRREVEFEADYVGFTMEDGFVVGYGLDFDEKSRFHPEVYVVDE
ncbi:MAG TPA: hypoxanthine phosphoribosyltransferase [Syntrophales bacterium]|nr:hypoxanthine phosphoribosyltransferase [Syntrophales bacterium]HRT26518.1 hypoxanthine phosphoribosyltransferase [Syntrophales bacterium]HRT69771.1 hypoxanthine phosphoribosyltransferase [Syntrophales bacterium]